MRHIYKKPFIVAAFISQLKENSPAYGAEAAKIAKLAKKQDGFLGLESIRDPSGKGITLSFWQDMQSIEKWKNHPDHLAAKKQGKEKWYKDYSLIISKVE